MDDDAECRYKSLLQPIRDLASNWDVDIAESLEEYLEDLESIQVTLDGGSTHINFAEAALLIQGSTAVYSKKVEYLHGLVLQALELITQQRGGANGKRGADKTGNKGDGSSTASSSVAGNAGKEKAKLSVMEDERFLFGSDPTYLLLDDCVEEAMNIDLAAAVDLKQGPDLKIDATQLPQGRGDLARSSMALMHSIMARDHGGGNQLNMASCLMSSTGALIMGGLAHVGGDNEQRPAYEDDGYDADDFGPGPGHFYDDGGDDDDDGYFAGAVDGNGNGNNEVDMASTNLDPAADSDTNAKPALAPAAGSGKAATVKAKVQTKVQTKAQGDRDPLALLDPHEALSGSRPAKRGATFRLPPSLAAAATADAAAATAPSSSSARSGKAKAKAASKANQAAVALDLFTSLLQGTVSQQPKAVLHECFAPLVRAQRRARLFEARAKAREGGRGGRSAAAVLRIDDFIYAADDDDADIGGAGLGGEDYEHYADAGAAFWGGDDDDDLDAPYEDHEGEQFPLSLVSEEEELHRRMQRVLDEGLQQAGQSNYELLCRRHVDAFLRGAEQYARCVPIPLLTHNSHSSS